MRTLVILCLLTCVAATPSSAQWLQHDLDSATTAVYWTPERYEAARPFVPEHWRGRPPSASPAPVANEAAIDLPAAPPTAPVLPNLDSRLFVPRRAYADAAITVQAAPDVGTAKAFFSSSRLVPLEADLFYPYRTVGKLFFTVPGVSGGSMCSGAVIAPRLVLTAGHCVHSGKSANGFYTNFEFIPSFHEGADPFGTWTVDTVFVTTAWATGQGKVPNAADFAILVMDDLEFSDGNIYRIGDVVGRLGVTLGALKTNHVVMLGYPGSLDGGNLMHQVFAGHIKFDSTTNTVTYGTDMAPGSSGGPWVQNFGIPSAGQTVMGGAAAWNRVVGVMSFVSKDKRVKVGGSSLPDNRLASIINAACAEGAGNC